MTTLSLYIDETGNDNPLNKQSEYYILCGIVVLKDKQEDLKILSDQIKFKYWNRTNIVFHSIDIQRNQKDFILFNQNPTFKDEFLKDLFKLLNSGPFKILSCVVNKDKAREKGWNRVKVLQETSKSLFKNYLVLLTSIKNTNGRIIVEASSSEKDIFYLKALSYFLTNGIYSLKIDSSMVRSRLTSISFVSKKNNDIEEQIADLIAYGIKCYLEYEKGEIFHKNSYEYKILQVVKSKLYSKPSNTRKNLLNEVNPLELII